MRFRNKRDRLFFSVACCAYIVFRANGYVQQHNFYARQKEAYEIAGTALKPEFMGEYDRAISLVEKALALQPDDAFLIEQLHRCLTKKQAAKASQEKS